MKTNLLYLNQSFKGFTAVEPNPPFVQKKSTCFFHQAPNIYFILDKHKTLILNFTG